MQNIQSDEEHPSLLVIVLDVNPVQWKKKAVDKLKSESSTKVDVSRNITLPELLDVLLVFLESFLLVHRGNEVVVIGASATHSKVVYPLFNKDKKVSSIDQAKANKDSENIYGIARSLKLLQEESEARQKNLENKAAIGSEVFRSSTISQAFSIALCYMQRMKREVPGIIPRLLNIQVSEDLSPYYNSVMNCIFSAQKDDIPVDACILSDRDSIFMQQACYLTGGVYLKPRLDSALLQQFYFAFLPSTQCRKFLKSAKQKDVDFRAACFCHRKVVDTAYVCSVCLSIFCDFSAECGSCGTRAKPKKLVRKP